MTLEEIQSRLVQARDRFRRHAQPLEQPPAEPEPDLQHDALAGLCADERMPALLTWLDSQISIAKLQRNSPEVRARHTDLLSLLGFENGLEAVRSFLTSFTKE